MTRLLGVEESVISPSLLASALSPARGGGVPPLASIPHCVFRGGWVEASGTNAVRDQMNPAILMKEVFNACDE